MTVDNAVSIMSKIIQNTIDEYNQSEQSKDSDGNRIPHPLDIVDGDDMLFALDISIKDVALKTIPVSLVESQSSTASELRRVSKDFYVRVPSTPILGEALDIDDGLSYAVVFGALGYLWDGFSGYEQRADVIVTTYDQAYRTYITELIAGTVSSGNEAYIRFSQDGENWHDGYSQGDIYISFKRIDTDSWTQGIRFVGRDGSDGTDGTPCSDTMFTELRDTPDSITPGKMLIGGDNGSLIEVDPPSGGGAEKFVDLSDTPSTITPGAMLIGNADGTGLDEIQAPFFGIPFYNDDAQGDFELDCSKYTSFYLYPNGDTNFTFRQFNDDGDQVYGRWGAIYTFAVVNGGNYTITFDSAQTIYGDASISGDQNETDYHLTILRMYFDGYSWVVLERVVVTDYQP